MFNNTRLMGFALLLWCGSQAWANVVFTQTPPNPSLTDTPLTFVWIDDCEIITIDFGDGITATNPQTDPNIITHVYEIPGVYHVILTGETCDTIGTQNFMTVFIEESGGGDEDPIIPPPSQIQSSIEIERLQLYFDNRQPNLTVPRNETDLKAHASIRNSGSGLLQAYWEVDGRVIERIERHLLSGGSLELSTPEYLPLPTFISGPHRLRLVVTRPAINPNKLPEAVYFVSELDVQSAKPELLTPLDSKFNSDSDSIEFRWHNPATPPGYLLEIFGHPGTPRLFSAYTSKPYYRFPALAQAQFLRDGETYRWQVSVLDASGKPVVTSEQGNITLLKRSWTVDRQFLLIVDDSMLGSSIKQKVIREFQLDVIEEFKLVSLARIVVVFQSDREGTQLLNELRQQQGVIGAQPDYIYRTSAATHQDSAVTQEPLQDLVSLSNQVDFNELHKKLDGYGSRIAIIDTGVETTHPDLIEANIETANFIHDETYRAEIHGTAMTGIIAAQPNQVGIVGLAPRADILALRACRQLQNKRPKAECYSSSLAKAVDRAINSQVQLTNFSFGTPSFDTLLGDLIAHGRGLGMLFVAAAGNEPDQDQLSFPASHPAVLSVAGQDGAVYFPNKVLAIQADMLAPAEQIFTTVIDSRHNFINGTSISSAIASGVLTLALPPGNHERLELGTDRKSFCDWFNHLVGMPTCKQAQ